MSLKFGAAEARLAKRAIAIESVMTDCIEMFGRPFSMPVTDGYRPVVLRKSGGNPLRITFATKAEAVAYAERSIESARNAFRESLENNASVRRACGIES